MLKPQTTLYTSRSKTVSGLFKALKSVPPVPVHNVLRRYRPGKSRPVISGVYVFSEPPVGKAPEKVLYVGQTINLFARLEEHCAVKDNDSANFAYMMTVKRTGLKLIPDSPYNTKKKLMASPPFEKEFPVSIQHIMGLNFRFIEENDVLTKNLLEIYAAVVLESEFNEFG